MTLALALAVSFSVSLAVPLAVAVAMSVAMSVAVYVYVAVAVAVAVPLDVTVTVSLVVAVTVTLAAMRSLTPNPQIAGGRGARMARRSENRTGAYFLYVRTGSAATTPPGAMHRPPAARTGRSVRGT